jgi:tetratricopeptide (TPR) repeat protein
MWGYDAWGHVAYVLFLDLYRAVPWADQGWSYFHPPLHYALGWVLAQFGSGDALMRGLSLLGSAASLLTAALAALLVRMASPGRPALALLAFTAVAFLPVHLFMRFVANENRPCPQRSGDVLCGALIGLALLTKFNGLLPLLVVCAALALRPLFAEDRRGELWRCLARGALIAGIALAIAFPYYARNIRAFGTPFQLSRDYPLIAEVEGDQPPGRRALSDYFRITPRMFSEPNPLAPHMLHSIWGTVYLNVWADIFRESDVERSLVAERSELPSTTLMALLGLFPTALAWFGAALAMRDAWEGRRRPVYVPLLLLAGATLASFAVFAWRVPIWSALKASYLLGLSLPYAVFVARAVEGIAVAGPVWWRAGPPALFGAVSALAAIVALEGVVLPRRADAPATGAVRFYFGEYEAASRVYGRLVAGAGYKAPWLDSLAAVNLLDGHPDRARRLYARAVATGLPDSYRRGRLAVATALNGDPGAARAELDAALAEQRLPELLANRGAVRTVLGDLAGAEADLRDALALSSAMVPAWRNLAVVLARAGRPQEGERARRRAEREACTAPRGYPYGLGTGEVLEWGIGRRWLLLLEGDRLRPATPSFYRDMCAALRREGGTAAVDAVGAS